MRRHVQLSDLEEDYSSAWLPSLIIFVVVFIISSIGLWKIFTKAGKAGL
jgi:sensor domain CHASE-containing protein